MSIFNDIGKKTSDIKNKITEETKLKMSISKNKDRITEIYEEIGKCIYERHLNSEIKNIEEIIDDKCIELDKVSREIEEANRKLLQTKNKKQCTRCYAELQLNAKFCDQCGQEQESGKSNKENVIIEENKNEEN